MASRTVVYSLALLLFLQLASTQNLTLSDCAANCTSVVTSTSGCELGVQCFCTNAHHDLFNRAKSCWESNCSIREGLTAVNVTSISCNFPDRDRGPTSSAVTFTSMSIALCLVALRIVAKTPEISKLWWWDDVLVGFATLLMIGNSVCNPISRHYGYGHDAWRLPFENTKTVEMMFFIGGIIYTLGVATTKIAFLLFYIKLFPSKTFRWVAYPLLTVTCIHGIIFTFLFTFQCSPVSYAWTQWDGTGKGKCLDFDLGAVVHAVTNILLDFLIFALPIWQLWNLKLSRKKKLQVISMLGVGFFVTLVSILRLGSLVMLGNTWNPTWDFVPFDYWSDLELNVGIACICMPSARVVVRRYFPNWGLATTDRHGPVSGPDMAVRPLVLQSNKPNLKLFMPSSRRVTADDASDQVELFPYTISAAK